MPHPGFVVCVNQLFA